MEPPSDSSEQHGEEGQEGTNRSPSSQRTTLGPGSAPDEDPSAANDELLKAPSVGTSQASAGRVVTKRTLQNRKAQKDFRIRRATYLKHLEAKVREYEQDGGGSTQEMQQTISQLAQENHYLRTIVDRLQEELAGYRSQALGQTTLQQDQDRSQRLQMQQGPGSAPPTADRRSSQGTSDAGPSSAPFYQTSFMYDPSGSYVPGMTGMMSGESSPGLVPPPDLLADAGSSVPTSPSAQTSYENLPDAWAAPFHDPFVSLETPPLDTVVPRPRPLFPATAVSPGQVAYIPGYFSYPLSFQGSTPTFTMSTGEASSGPTPFHPMEAISEVSTAQQSSSISVPARSSSQLSPASRSPQKHPWQLQAPDAYSTQSSEGGQHRSRPSQ